MPCQDHGPVRLYEDTQKVDRLTQDLCFLCANLMGAEILEKYASSRIQEWHKKHMTADKQRVTKELKAAFFKDNELINTPEKLAEQFIINSERYHPVSNWHKAWLHKLAKDISKQMPKLIEQKQEQAKKKALNKLTLEEKVILGLDNKGE